MSALFLASCCRCVTTKATIKSKSIAFLPALHRQYSTTRTIPFCAKENPKRDQRASTAEQQRQEKEDGKAPQRQYRFNNIKRIMTNEPPMDPSLVSSNVINEAANQLHHWLLQTTTTNNNNNTTSSLSNNNGRIIVLTGAGISTESGIPDYRGANGAYYNSRNHTPMLHQEFMSNHTNRQRYWGRSLIGWKQSMESAKPNRGHLQLHKLLMQLHERQQQQSSPTAAPFIITQNVDGLHHKAATECSMSSTSNSLLTQNDNESDIQIVELHGNTRQLICMNCGQISDRSPFQDKLQQLNQDWLLRQQEQTASLRPDGDANIAQNETFDTIQVPSCSSCHVGILKPNVVFFGDNVDPTIVKTCQSALAPPVATNHHAFEVTDSTPPSGLLCIGTSLAVYSALRLVKLAHSKQIPICILNVGMTRPEQEGWFPTSSPLSSVTSASFVATSNGDSNKNNVDSNSLMMLKLEAPIGPTLEQVVQKFDSLS